MKKFILVLCILMSGVTIGQIGPRQIIADDGVASDSIFPVDLDQDGDIDLVSARGSNQVVWYENLGNDEFSQMHIISSNFGWARTVYSGDIDNDGDIDVVTADISFDNIVLSRNMDGIGQNWIEEVILTDLSPNGLCLADLDDDGDLDVIATSQGESKLVWFTNLDGAGNFGEEIVIYSNLVGHSFVNHSDLDNDGDIDLLTASYDDKIIWFQNDGQANFVIGQTIASEPNTSVNYQYVGSADLDNGGDFDVISGASSGDTVAWYENLNGNGDFGEKIVVDNMAFSVFSIASIDIDNDGDKDLLTGGSALFKLVWYENQDGKGSFSDQIFIDEIRATRVAAADIDNDGDEDLISTNHGLPNNTINWYENEFLLSNSIPSKSELVIFPNPTKTNLNIKYDLPIENVSVYSMLGELISSEKNTNQIDFSSHPNGVYFVKVETEKGSVFQKVLKE